MSTTKRKLALTNNRVGNCAGRLIGGSWGRPCKARRTEANRGVRRYAKQTLRGEFNEQV